MEGPADTAIETFSLIYSIGTLSRVLHTWFYKLEERESKFTRTHARTHIPKKLSATVRLPQSTTSRLYLALPFVAHPILGFGSKELTKAHCLSSSVAQW